MFYVGKMIGRFQLIKILIHNNLFQSLPCELFSRIIELSLPYKWLTIFNVSPYSISYRSSLFQTSRSVIPRDSIHVRYYACADSIELSCGTWRKLKSAHTAVVFAYGNKVPKWVWLLRERESCLVI